MTIYARTPSGRFAPRWTVDPMDPRGWGSLDPEPVQRIYLDNRELHCLVDYEDWLWARDYAWRATESKTKGKFYATRDTTIDGQRVKLFLHKEILKRVSVPPSARHIIGDHKDGDSLNDTRGNLRWATPSQNSRNRYGFLVRQPDLFARL